MTVLIKKENDKCLKVAHWLFSSIYVEPIFPVSDCFLGTVNDMLDLNNF